MRCKVCGGTVSKFGNKYFQCDYCNQFFGLNEEEISSDKVYSYAVERINAGTQEGCEEAIQLFSSIPQFKDSADRVKQGYGNIERMRVEEEEKRLEDERKRIFEEKQKIETEKKTRATMRIMGIAAVLVVCIIVVLVRNRTEKIEYYESAKLMFENGEYENSIITFQKTKGYLDSNEYIYKAEQEIEKIETTYRDAVSKYEAQNYEKSYDLFLTIREYKDVEEYINLIFISFYENARVLFEKGDYKKAIEILNSIPSEADCYADVNSLIISINEAIQEKEYEEAVTLYNEGDLLEAQKLFVSFGDYCDSNSFRNAIGSKLYEEATTYFNQKEYVECANVIDKIDASEEWEEYEKAVNLLETNKTEYKNNVETEAVSILRRSGYSEFTEFVRSKENILFSRSESDSFINQYKPVYLLNVDTYAEDGYIYIGTDYAYYTAGNSKDVYKDNLGNTYSWGINRRVPNYSMSDSYIEYRVTEYNNLSGTLILNYDSRSNTEAGYMRIYGDDALIYTSPAICKGFDPLYINIDISGVDIIRLEIDGFYSNVSFIEPSVSK